ncbi:MAG: hypothetical protein AB1410_07105 [Acidobacteriota bacterium]
MKLTTQELSPFFLGFFSLGFQIILIREFSSSFYGNEIIFGIFLSFWLFWGGVGALLAEKIKFKKHLMVFFYYMVLILIVFALIVLRYSKILLGFLPGEIPGLLPTILVSFIINFIVTLPLGIIFVLNVEFLKGNLSKTYILESLGSAVSCIIIYFLIIPKFSNWQGLTFIAISGLIFLSSFLEKKRFVISIILISISLAFGFLLDKITMNHAWNPFHLERYKDTLYGKIAVIKQNSSISVYENGLFSYTYPDREGAEESVHFILLQRENPENLLLIGGGMGGSLEEALKYKNIEIDYVELDPEIIKISLDYLDEKEKILEKRINYITGDGRFFLINSVKKWDAIILNLPEPSNALTNRFYTEEFFRIVKERLTDDGIFSLKIPSSENYISEELLAFVSSIFHTLKSVFKNVEIIPGNTNIFIASNSFISIEPEFLINRKNDLEIETYFFNAPYLFNRLSPFRLEMLSSGIERVKKIINRDFMPTSYFLNSILWSSFYDGIEKGILKFLYSKSSFWLIDLPVLLFASILVINMFRKKNPFLLPIWTIGFTSISVEIIIILAFQAIFGYFYGKISLLLFCFMAGLYVGSFLCHKKIKIKYTNLLMLQFLILISIFFIIIFLKFSGEWSGKFNSYFFYLILFVFGVYGGGVFVISTELYLKEKRRYGIGWALDLFGSSIGALLISTVLIPLFGLLKIMEYIFILNSLSFGYLTLKKFI